MKVSCLHAVPTSIIRGFRYIALVSCILAHVKVGLGQTLSANSGINALDTHVVFDLTDQSTESVTLPNAVYNPSTKTVTDVLNVSPLTRTMHVEAGYDTTGSLVLNLYLTPSSANPDQVSVSPVSVVRFAKGQITLFDTNNVQIPLLLPNSGIAALLPESILGSNGGVSLIGKLAISNIQTFATEQSATLAVSGTTATLAMPTPSGTPGLVWTYAQSGLVWVPQQVAITPSIENASVIHTLQFANLSVFDNATADAARASSLKAPTTSPTSYTDVSAEVTPPTTSTCNKSVTQQYQLGGTQNISFEHGFNSNPCTWVRMVPWINADFILGTEFVSKTDSMAGIASQASQLEGEITSAGGSNYILVAHSAGGLVSRMAAQYFQTTVTPTRGVATLDTPHLGTDLSVNGPLLLGFGEAWAGSLFNILDCYTPYDNVGCFMAWLGGSSAGFLGSWAVVNTNDAISDMTPGSSLLTNLNNPSKPENFLQGAVISETPQRWLVARELDEMLNQGTCNPEDACGERAVAQDVEYFYDGVGVDLIVSLLAIQYCEEYSDGNCPDWLTQILDNQINFDESTLLDMNVIDAIYDAMMGCSIANLECEGSDGLVQFSSQYYPSPHAMQVTIVNGDAHGGAPRSTYDHTALDYILSQKFGLLTPATCSFASSSNTFGLSATGGAETLNLTTGQGCQWSVSSNAPWLQVNTLNGTSSGPISFTALPNPLSTPKLGTLTIGNSTNTTVVNVSEAGVCTYTLSPGPTIAVPGTGQTGQISVSTQTGCIWSAVSSAEWLTISTSGNTATGTGPGPFQFTAGANNTGSDLSATVTVEGQTITVLQGTSSGAAGRGTVTISGSPQSVTVNECPGSPNGPCNVTIQESGAVIVTVNGQSYGAGYSSSGNSAASLASSLAAQMNTPSSLISATVSGATITITATIDGVATDYPLSTSFQFNTYFSSPAFQATASGAALTGGQN